MQQKDMQALLRRLTEQKENSEAARAAASFQQMLNTPQGRQLAQQLMNSHSGSLAHAAALAQSGDMAGAKQALQQLMQTPEGVQIAGQLSRMMGR